MAKPASGTSINGSQPLAASLTAAWGLLENTGTTSADGTGNGHTLTLGTGAAWGTSGSDVAIALSGAGASPLAVTSPIALAGNAPWSVAWRGHQTSSGNAGMAMGDNTNTTDFVWMQGGTGLKLRDHNSADFTFTPTSFTADADYVLAFDRAANKLHAYVDGAEVNTGGLTVGPTAGDGSITINTLGNGYTASTFSLAGALTYAYVWTGRTLSSSDAATLHADPYTPYRASAAGAVMPPPASARQAVNRASTY